MDGFEFNVNEKIKMKFGIVGGSYPAPVLPIVECTQEQYDAMQTHDANTLYAIPEVSD